MYSEKTPVAALALHWVLTTIMVVIPVMTIKSDTKYSAGPAQKFLSGAFAYVIDITFFVLVSFGLLCLRFTPSIRWSQKSELKNPIVSITAALILFTLSMFPFICIWIPDREYPYLIGSSGLVSWYATQTAGLVLFFIAFLYWIIFRAYIKIRSSREGKTLHIKREPKFRPDGHTQLLEIVTLQWKRDVDLRLDEIEQTDDEYPSSTLRSGSQAPDLRLRNFGDRDRRSPLSARSTTPHEIGTQDSIRRKPIMSELLA